MDNPAQTTYNKGCANTGLGGRLGRDDTRKLERRLRNDR